LNETVTAMPVPLYLTSATVIIPPESGVALHAQCFTGAYVSTAHELTTTVKANTADYETTNPLPMRGGMTINLYLPKGILEEPSTATRIAWFVRSNPVVFVPEIGRAHV